jgi:hypothetical protein
MLLERPMRQRPILVVWPRFVLSERLPPRRERLRLKVCLYVNFTILSLTPCVAKAAEIAKAAAAAKR